MFNGMLRSTSISNTASKNIHLGPLQTNIPSLKPFHPPQVWTWNLDSCGMPEDSVDFLILGVKSMVSDLHVSTVGFDGPRSLKFH
jgi:hypothetical protein